MTSCVPKSPDARQGHIMLVQQKYKPEPQDHVTYSLYVRFKFYTYLLIFFNVRVNRHVCLGTRVGVREHLFRVNFLLPVCGFRGLNSGCQACRVTLPALFAHFMDEITLNWSPLDDCTAVIHLNPHLIGDFFKSHIGRDKKKSQFLRISKIQIFLKILFCVCMCACKYVFCV